MADLDDIKAGKDFGIGRPADTSRFFSRNSADYDWGMEARLSRTSSPESGYTVMLAFNRRYFQAPPHLVWNESICPLRPLPDMPMC